MLPNLIKMLPHFIKMLPNFIRSARKLTTPCISFIRTKRAAFSSSSIMSFQYDSDPYEYTSGCWLRADAAQRDARRVRFDFATLCQKAINSSPSAKKILQGVKVEGNFNRAFILHLDNGSRVVARIPFSVAGPSRLVTNSEVATIAYSKGVPLSVAFVCVVYSVLTHHASPGKHQYPSTKDSRLE